MDYCIFLVIRIISYLLLIKQLIKKNSIQGDGKDIVLTYNIVEGSIKYVINICPKSNLLGVKSIFIIY